jgi:glycosyltransferase involved in cell wall biosynthesis
VRLAFFVRKVTPEGGLTLATVRLASALHGEQHETYVLYCAGKLPPGFDFEVRRVEGDPEGTEVPVGLKTALEELSPDVVIVGSGVPEDLSVSSTVAPALLHAHLHWGTCADQSRYWSRAGGTCRVKAGWHCAPLRPLLGCSDVRTSLKVRRIASQVAMLKILASGGAGVLCVSSSQAETYERHGVARERLTVIPNLGIAASANELKAAAESIPEEWRSATTFVGRLSKLKGGQHLEALSALLNSEAKLRIFGDGYLLPKLAGLPPGTLCGSVTQDQVAGVLMWARSIVFPSVWPEPGGIVGIDAQIMDVPLAAFDTGAARHWPQAELFRPKNLGLMAAWLNEQETRTAYRDPKKIARAQTEYASRVGAHAALEITSYLESRSFALRAAGYAESLIGSDRRVHGCG